MQFILLSTVKFEAHRLPILGDECEFVAEYLQIDMDTDSADLGPDYRHVLHGTAIPFSNRNLTQ